MTVGLHDFLVVGALLFLIGAAGVIGRKNLFIIFMSIELMLNAVNLAFVTFGRYLNSQEGQVFAFMVVVVAASEVVVGLALITTVFRTGRDMDVDDLSEMRE